MIDIAEAIAQLLRAQLTRLGYTVESGYSLEVFTQDKSEHYRLAPYQDQLGIIYKPGTNPTKIVAVQLCDPDLINQIVTIILDNTPQCPTTH